MKVVVYSPTFHPVVDGTSIQARRMLDLLSRHYDSYGVTFSVDRDLKPMDYNAEDNVFRLNPEYRNGSKFPILGQRSLIKKLDEIKPDAIHIRGWYQLPNIGAIIDNYGGSSIVLFWYCDGLHECHEKFKNDSSYHDVVNAAKRKGVFFVGQSRKDIEIFHELGIPEGSTTLIPPILRKTNKKFKKDFSRPSVLSVGRFYDYKGHEEVAEKVRGVYPNIDIVLAGAADTEEGKEIVSKLIDNNVSILLNPSDLFIDMLFERSTHYVSASTRETLGVATLEAVNAGCLPMVRKIGGIVDYLDERFLFENNEDFRTKFSRVVDGPFDGLLENLKPVMERIRYERVEEAIIKIHGGVL